MAPRRAVTPKRRKRANGTTPSRNSNGVPGVYEDMLLEASNEPSSDAALEQRPFKRRKAKKVDHDVGIPPSEFAAADVAHSDASSDLDSLFQESEPEEEEFEDVPMGHPQTISADESEDSDVYVEADIQDQVPSSEMSAEAEPDHSTTTQDLSIVLDAKPKHKHVPSPRKRKPLSNVEKEVRLVAHKMHIVCLLRHISMRNQWCNHSSIWDILKRLVAPKIITLLNPNPNQIQAQRTLYFLQGLKSVAAMWRNKFTLSETGMTRASGVQMKDFQLPPDVETHVELSDFRAAAKGATGSADTGAQLFCALLRSVGVDARLVCSLQVIGIAGNAVNSAQSAVSEHKPTIYANSLDQLDGSRSTGKPVNVYQNLALNSLGSSISRPLFPIYWVEAFNEAVQKWVTVDPIATNTVGKPMLLEPPMSNPSCQMSYVFAFEDNGVARDVTKRYAKAFYAKTRRLRVEATEGGERWLRRATQPLTRRGYLDRDQVEDAELTQKIASEGMPRNVDDFKNHPFYALERHLKHNEVIHPNRVVGRVTIGTKSDRTEPVHRRQDVYACKSADKWFRLGREVKPGEQPLRHGKRRMRPSKTLLEDAENDDAADDPGSALYAQFQTDLYVPPPVIRGLVPKNSFGNIDVYVPSMVPHGAVHLRSPDASRAAQLLGIDYAEAVTGFKFKGRQGTAVVTGAVVAKEFAAAVSTTVQAFEYARERAEAAKRSKEALRMWRRFYKGLLILMHVAQYDDDDNGDGGGGGREASMDVDVQQQLDREEAVERIAENAGGFFPDAAAADTRSSSLVRPAHLGHGGGGGGGGFISETLQPGGFEQPSFSHGAHQAGGFISEAPQPGGFFADDAADALEKPDAIVADARPQALPAQATDAGGGGFIPDDTVPGPDAAPVHSSSHPFPDPPASDTMDVQQHTVDVSAGGFVPEDPVPVTNPVADTAQVEDDRDLERAEPAGSEPQGLTGLTLRNGKSDEAALRVNSSRASTSSTPVGMAREMEEERDNGEGGVDEGNEVVGEEEVGVVEGSDHGSMLSHDPEEDEMEPDWGLE